MKPLSTDQKPARRTQCALSAVRCQLSALRAQASEPTPAKMAREMLEADRRAQKRRHRARRARKVHTQPLIRPETFEPGNPPCPSEASTRPPLCEAPRSGRCAAANRRSCGAADAAARKRTVHRSPFTVHASEASAWPDLLLAAILWGLALVCVGLTLAIATGIALHLFGLE